MAGSLMTQSLSAMAALPAIRGDASRPHSPFPRTGSLSPFRGIGCKRFGIGCLKLSVSATDLNRVKLPTDRNCACVSFVFGPGNRLEPKLSGACQCHSRAVVGE